MRIERIDIDIDGWKSLSGSFHFPASGTGLWATGGNSGKSLLVPLIATVLYGRRDEEARVPSAGWVMIRLNTDDGERLVVARDLATGTLQVTDTSGADITERWADGLAFGEQLLGFTRSQFLSVAQLGFDDLANTIGNPTLRAMLSRGRGPQATAAGAPAPAAAPATSDSSRTDEPHASDDDLPIFHSAAEEMKWSGDDDISSSERLLALGDEMGADSPGAPAISTPTATGENANDENAYLRQLKSELDSARRHLAAKNEQYREFSDHLKELSAEQDRLGSLDGAEPADVERLGQLVTLMKKVTDRREQLGLEEAKFRAGLDERDVDPEALAPLDKSFRSMTDADRAFLEGYRQTEAVLRGNQALTRSESRLEESSVHEIDRAREDASRMTLAPFAVAALGLFGSVAIHVFPAIPVPPAALLVAGLLGASGGAALLWRAKRTRGDERGKLLVTLERMKEQLSQFDREADEAKAQLAALQEEYPFDEDADVLSAYESWLEHKAELRELSNFARRDEEIGREAVTLREKLGSFTASVSDDPNEMSDQHLDTMMQDYLRHFAVREEVAEAEAKAEEHESALAATEGEIAELRVRISAILEAVEISADRDLDEAIEIHALRTGQSSARVSKATPDPADPAEDDEAGPREIAIEDNGPEEATWTAALSVRVEAILRRFLPEARDVEVDPALIPHLRLAADGPRLSADSPREFGSAILDQVCLALRLAIVETLSSSAERVPVFLDDPFVRSDDARHDSAIEFLVEDASTRGQVVLMTSHEVRTRWYLHQHPQHRDVITSLRDPEAAGTPSPASREASSSHSS